MTNLTPELQEVNERIKAFNAKRQANLKNAKAKTKIKVETSKNIHGAMVGDKLCSTWGYDQTNYDFFEVIKVTEKTVTVKELGGYNDGKIFQARKTKCYRDGEYWISIDSVRSASFDLNDRNCKKAHAKAQEDLSNPYRNTH